ncbi:MAG: non-ribosomal peptide synthetase, partial [Deltaproteobacteria bacterium]|nr:non-ribosomal peptide synthetase [Deltaproteobacteria bacterium]
MKNVEDAFPLSPMQQGMLFHTVFAQSPGMYLEQVRATLEGELDLARLEAAWQQVVDRHSVLRTAFVWESLDEPLQVVRSQVPLPWGEHDLRPLDPEEQQTRLAQILQADRDRGFEMARAPLMRCTLVRKTDRSGDLIWTYHHIILDGWCS